MSEILCSTGALIGRPNGRDYRLLEKYAPLLRCDGFEFILYETWYPELETLRHYLKGLQLNIPVFHCEKTLAERITAGGDDNLKEALRLFEINCDLAGDLGSRKMVLHLWNGVISDSHFENNLAAFGLLRQIAAGHGIDLLVENVICRGDPMNHWVELYREYPDIHFIFDTKMADFHRQMDLLYAPEYAWLWKENHIRHYHVNDYSGGYMEWNNLKVLVPGEGHIDFDRFYDFVKMTGYADTFTFEATGFGPDGTVNICRLNGQFDRAGEILKARDEK